MLLFYIRHGDPIYDPDSLTPLGIRQAESVAKRLALYGIDKIYASTSQRAICTAKPTAEMTKNEIQLLDFCNEYHAWNDFAVENENGGKTWGYQLPEIKRLFLSAEVTALGDRWYEHPAFANSNFKRGIERVNRETDRFLLSLGYQHNREGHYFMPVHPTQERIAVFAHQGFGKAFLSSVLDIPYPIAATRLDMSHTGVTVIEFRVQDGIVIPIALTVGNDSHLYRDGLPTNYHNALRF